VACLRQLKDWRSHDPRTTSRYRLRLPAKRPPSRQRFWRSRRFARTRHRLLWLRRTSPRLTRAHAELIRLSGGRIRRSFLFTGGLPLLVITTVGRNTGQKRSTPLGYVRHGQAFAVIASNAGSRTELGKNNYTLVRHEWASATSAAAGDDTSNLDAALALLRAIEAGLVAARPSAPGRPAKLM
jgi:hypothetical protein